MSAPDRIWIEVAPQFPAKIPPFPSWNDDEADPSMNQTVEYVRADLCAPTQDERVKALVALLREARDDIAVYVDADYPEISRATYPDIQRRWHRDMELCRRIDAALRDMGVK